MASSASNYDLAQFLRRSLRVGQAGRCTPLGGKEPRAVQVRGALFARGRRTSLARAGKTVHVGVAGFAIGVDVAPRTVFAGELLRAGSGRAPGTHTRSMSVRGSCGLEHRGSMNAFGSGVGSGKPRQSPCRTGGRAVSESEGRRFEPCRPCPPQRVQSRSDKRMRR
jgi:hypothetical protein